LASRTIVQLVADVERKARGQCRSHEARQAIQNAINYVDAKANWEFLLKSAQINIQPTYSTGTVAISAGGTAVTGTGTTWSAAWVYRTIKFASRQLPYKVSSFGGVTTATLASALSGSDAITADTYVVYQQRYALPSDCEPGRDLFVRGPQGTGVKGGGIIPKIGRLSFESKYPYSTGPVTYYTDDEYDATNNVATIKFGPAYPVASGEYQIVYYGKFTVPTTDASVTIIPEAFERILINLAVAEVIRDKGAQGWLAYQMEAEQLMNQLYNRFAASPAYLNEPDVEDVPDIAASDSLMFVRR
jgi:hypothetical protein